MLVNMSSSYDDFYPVIAIATLMRVMRDPSLFVHHTTVVQAVTFIFTCLGVRCVPYIQQVLPAFVAIIRTSDTREVLIKFIFLYICNLQIFNFFSSCFSSYFKNWGL